MALITTIVTADSDALKKYEQVIGAIAPDLLPSGQRSLAWSKTSADRGMLFSVLGRRDHVTIRGCNVLAGVTIPGEGSDNWWQPGTNAPDGSYVLLRSNSSELQFVSDYAGSMTIWHSRLACGGIVASTCFELVIAVLGSFELDEKSLGWFLSSGTVGPRRSWDRRIRPLPQNSCLQVSKKGGQVAVRESTLDQTRYTTTRADEDFVRDTLEGTLRAYRFGDKPWLLALSGGYDSRAMLYGTRHLEKVTCVTWVDEALTERQGSDLDIACRLAREAGREHVVKTLRRPADAAELDNAAARFARYADGRVDNLFAYLDGMQIWDEIDNLRIGGLLRGDELFGSAYATRESQILHNMRLDSFLDFAPSETQKSLYHRFDHEIPIGLLRRDGESVQHWRWRLRSTFEIPSVYAALNSVRGRFLQCACPLLSRRLVDLAGALPSADHEDRALYKKVVDSMYEGIPIATTPSVMNRSNFLAMPQAIELLLGYLGGSAARDVLGSKNARKVSAAIAELQAISRPGDAQAPPRKRTYIPDWAKRTKRNLRAKQALHLPTLGMRSYLAHVVEREMVRTVAAVMRSSDSAPRAIA